MRVDNMRIAARDKHRLIPVIHVNTQDNSSITIATGLKGYELFVELCHDGVTTKL